MFMTKVQEKIQNIYMRGLLKLLKFSKKYCLLMLNLETQIILNQELFTQVFQERPAAHKIFSLLIFIMSILRLERVSTITNPI